MGETGGGMKGEGQRSSAACVCVCVWGGGGGGGGVATIGSGRRSHTCLVAKAGWHVPCSSDAAQPPFTCSTTTPSHCTSRVWRAACRRLGAAHRNPGYIRWVGGRWVGRCVGGWSTLTALGPAVADGPCVPLPPCHQCVAAPPACAFPPPPSLQASNRLRSTALSSCASTWPTSACSSSSTHTSSRWGQRGQAVGSR